MWLGVEASGPERHVVGVVIGNRVFYQDPSTKWLLGLPLELKSPKR